MWLVRFGPIILQPTTATGDPDSHYSGRFSMRQLLMYTPSAVFPTPLLPTLIFRPPSVSHFYKTPGLLAARGREGSQSEARGHQRLASLRLRIRAHGKSIIAGYGVEDVAHARIYEGQPGPAGGLLGILVTSLGVKMDIQARKRRPGAVHNVKSVSATLKRVGMNGITTASSRANLEL